MDNHQILNRLDELGHDASPREYRDLVMDAMDSISRLTAENARLREALERIAMFQGVDSYGHVAIARQALKEGV